MDALMINSTQWNYTATNRNSPRIGDRWNQEDLSIYSVDQRVDVNEDFNTESVNELLIEKKHMEGVGLYGGGRGLLGIVRPFPHTIQGKPLSFHFDVNTSTFQLIFDADYQILTKTEIFIPRLQFPFGFYVKVTGPAKLADEHAAVTDEHIHPEKNRGAFLRELNEYDILIIEATSQGRVIVDIVGAKHKHPTYWKWFLCLVPCVVLVAAGVAGLIYYFLKS